MKTKRIYKKYLTMNPLHAANLYHDGKISYEKYEMAYYSKCRFMNKEKLIKLIYG